MTTSFVLSIDAGTTGIQTSLFETQTLSMYGNNKVEFKQLYPSPGLVEQNPQDIWDTFLQAYCVTLQLAQKNLPTQDLVAKSICAIGITNQRETCLAWNKRTGEIAGPAIVWQDRRTAEFCNSLKSNEQLRKKILQTTGLVCDPYFSASKMQWLFDNVPVVKQWHASNELAFGTIDCFFLWKLTKGNVFATDHTNASRTMLYNLHTGDYDDFLLDLFNIPRSALPQILPSIGEFGKTADGVHPQLPAGIPILGVLGDQQAALFGHSAVNSGDSKITFGTGAFLLMNVGENPVICDSGLLTTVAYSTPTQRFFALEGAAFIAGAAVQFLRDNFGWVKNSSESAQMAMSYPADDNVLFVPSLAGLGAPYWNPHAKGVLFGLTRGTNRPQIIRAVLESIALQNVQMLNMMEKASGTKLAMVGVDGGASRNDFLMQFQADVLQTQLIRPQNTETTSVGVAKAVLCALDSSFLHKKIDVDEKHNRSFTSKCPPALADAKCYRWNKAVECVNAFYESFHS